MSCQIVLKLKIKRIKFTRLLVLCYSIIVYPIMSHQACSALVVEYTLRTVIKVRGELIAGSIFRASPHPH